MKWSLFRNRDFRLFVGGQGAAIFGTLFLQMGLSLYVLDLTGSAGKFAFTLSMGLLPLLVLGLFAGVAVDRLPRKKLLVTIELIRGPMLLAMFAYACVQPLGEGMVYFLVAFLGACETFYLPAYVGVLPMIVKQEELVDANALKSTTFEMLTMLAPVGSAAVYSLAGMEACLLVNAVMFLLSGLSTWRVTLPPQPPHDEKASLVSDLRDGFSLFREDVRLTSLVVNGVLTHIFLTALVLVGFPYMVKQVFGGSNVDVGFVESAGTVGLLCSAVIVTFLNRRGVGVARGIWIGILGMTAATVPMFLLGSTAFTKWMGSGAIGPVAFFSSVAFVMCWVRGAYGVYFVSFYQGAVAGERMGRFFSIMSMGFGLGRLAGFQLYGVLLDRYALVVSIAVLGVGMVLKLVVHVPFLREEAKRQTVSAEAERSAAQA